MEKSGFRHFIELLNNNMNHCGALRIDHVMALFRLWWCPGTDRNGKGAYVHYPVDALFGILRIESQRHKCLVIGEDLGVVPPEMSHLLAESAVLSNALFYFEKYNSVQFTKPEHYPETALTMVANHDVATLKAWWHKSDLALREELGMYSNDQQYPNAIGSRESDLIQVLHWLDEQALLPSSWRHFNIHKPFDIDLCCAIIQALGRCRSLLLSLQLEDLCLAELPVNIPGTSDEYPNWRRKLPLSIDELFENHDATRILNALLISRAQ
jgi:4-alpha-glucanotransferase